MTTESKELAVKNTPYNRFKNLIKSDNVQERFQQLLEDRADYFLGSLMSLVTADNKLLECDPATIFQAAAKAAVLRLPVAKELGFAWIVPYGKKAEFVLGYKGMVQLAIRTSQYDILNTVVIYEGMEVTEDVLAGTISIKGERNGDEAVGYAAYFKLLNGFQKFQYMSSEDVAKHAQRYSASYQYGMRTGKKDSAWFTNFDEMAKKTVLRLLLSKWGLMSIEMLSADVADMPAIGDDERLAIPSFDDLNNPLEGSFREEEPDSESEPEPTNDERPYKPAVLRERLQSSAQWYDSRNKTATDNERKVLAKQLTTLFDGDNTKRYEATKYLAGVASTKELSDGMVKAMLGKWLEVSSFDQMPNIDALTEAKALTAAALKAEGQQELL